MNRRVLRLRVLGPGGGRRNRWSGGLSTDRRVTVVTGKLGQSQTRIVSRSERVVRQAQRAFEPSAQRNHRLQPLAAAFDGFLEQVSKTPRVLGSGERTPEQDRQDD